MKTKYYLATLRDAKEVYKKYGEKWEHTLPAIIARKAEIVGIIGCHYEDGIFLAGPYHADHPIIGLRLLERFEALLRSRGLQCYIFSVKKSNPWLKIVQRGNVTLLSQNTEFMWFKRDLKCPVVAMSRKA